MYFEAKSKTRSSSSPHLTNYSFLSANDCESRVHDHRYMWKIWMGPGPYMCDNMDDVSANYSFFFCKKTLQFPSLTSYLQTTRTTTASFRIRTRPTTIRTLPKKSTSEHMNKTRNSAWMTWKRKIILTNKISRIVWGLAVALFTAGHIFVLI